MRAILTAPVDLLWNGGIGTYVKASRRDQRRRRRQGQRRDPRRRRARCAAASSGEGGNLGFTQLGRIEAARHGVRINTDAIDNSAGVDTSDHEVNIKILLDQVVRDGDLTAKQRNDLLAEMTDDVGRLVLRDNYEQNILLGNARVQSHQMLTVHQRFIRELEARGDLDRALEFLPDRRRDRRARRRGRGALLTRVRRPARLREDHAHRRPARHRARRRAVVRPASCASTSRARSPSATTRSSTPTRCAARSSRRSSSTTWSTAAASRSRSARARRRAPGPVEVARAYSVAREVFALPAFWSRVEALDNQVPTVCPVRPVPRVAPPARPGHPLGAAVARRPGRRRGRDRPLPRARSPRIAPMVPEMLVGVEKDRLHERAAGARRASALPRTSRCSARRTSTSTARSTSSRSRRPRAPTPRTSRGSTSSCPSATRSTGCSPASPVSRATTAGARSPGPPCAPTSTARSSA